jgi:hypothetical protein
MVTLLVVTQDDDWRRRITEVVSDASVFSASTGAEALRQMERMEVDRELNFLIVSASSDRSA